MEKVGGILTLRENHACCCPRDRDPEEEREVPEVCHGELGVKQPSEVLEKPVAGGGDDDVVNVQEYVGDVAVVVVDEERHIRLRGDKAESMYVESEPLVPGSGSLLEAVQRLVEPADMVGVAGVDEAGRLLAVHLLVKSAVEEGVLDVKLVDRPGVRQGDAQDDADRGWLDDGAESLVEVDAGLLREAAHYPASLVASKATIRVKLVLEDPFA